MDNIVGIDLAKNSFAVHIANHEGRMIKQHKRVSRSALQKLFLNMSPSKIALEACGSAHHWARKLIEIGHQVKLIAPQFVKPYVKANKNDAHDAAAIAEAASRKHMNFVPVKNLQQQDLKMLHCIRDRLVSNKVYLTNQIRGILNEYGIVMLKGDAILRKKILELIDENFVHSSWEELTGALKKNLRDLFDELVELENNIAKKDADIKEICKQDDSIKELLKVPGIGPITASAVVAHVGDARTFKSGRQFAAYLGLTPRENSTGGKTRLLGISKRGNKNLRTLLIHGARSLITRQKFVKAENLEKWSESRSRQQRWAQEKIEIKGVNKAAVGFANKQARIIWAILSKGVKYDAQHISVRPKLAA